MVVQIMRRYESIGAFVKVCESSPADGSSNKSINGAGWSGAKDLKTAIRHAKTGDWEPEVATEFKQMFEQYLPRLRTFIADELERTPDVAGGDVNVQAFLDGEPESMYDWVQDEEVTTQRALCLLVNHSIHAGISAEELFVKGQAVVALVRALSLLGYELEIWSEVTVKGRNGGQYTTMVRLHGAGEIMDISAVEFAVGNPAWLRRLEFAAWECESPRIRDNFGFRSKSGYGTPCPPSHGDDVNADVIVDLGRSWGFSYDQSQWGENGFRWVTDQLKACGVIPEDAEV